ncbi:MAG: hypothetical protein M3083_10030 [Actinomycetota bacterium]|nr:hypothetical protein [Actinomycetota bacterium]
MPLPFGIRMRRSTFGLILAFLVVWVLYEGVRPTPTPKQVLVPYGPSPVATAPPATAPLRTRVAPRVTTTPPSVGPTTAPPASTTTTGPTTTTTVAPAGSSTTGPPAVSTSLGPPASAPTTVP